MFDRRWRSGACRWRSNDGRPVAFVSVGFTCLLPSCGSAPCAGYLQLQVPAPVISERRVAVDGLVELECERVGESLCVPTDPLLASYV